MPHLLRRLFRARACSSIIDLTQANGPVGTRAVSSTFARWRTVGGAAVGRFALLWFLGCACNSGIAATRSAKTPIAAENFSSSMDHWWTEGGERIWVEGGRLQMWSDSTQIPGGNVATAWWRRPLPANFELTLEAHVLSSSLGVNNINLFFSYTDPAKKPLEDSRESRKSAAYNLYHQLNGYIITFVREDGKARIRIRRNPGFVLLAESREGESDVGVTYQLSVRKTEGEIIFRLNGREMVRATDPTPWGAGLLGLRTFRTKLWWDNISVRELEP